MLPPVVVVLVLIAAGCSSGDDEGEDTTEGTATLEVIDRNIEVSQDGGPFETGTTGADLFVGDQVRADETGFGELSYFDGSWQRIEAEATLSIDQLADRESSDVVEVGIDGGRSWQRVEELSDSGDRFEVDTPVATASVRGTRFSIDCLVGPDQCLFVVIEGPVVLVLPDGTEIVLESGEKLAVTKGEEPGDPERFVPDELYEDEWIAKNLALDQAEFDDRGIDGPGASADPTSTDLAAATLAKTWTIDVEVVRSDDPRYPVGSSDTVRWLVEVVCDDNSCHTERRIVDEAGTPVFADGSGVPIIETIEASGPRRYGIEVTWTEPCEDSGTVLHPEGITTTKVAEYETVDAEFQEDRWVATELVGTAESVTELTAEGEAAGCVLPGGASNVTFETEVAAHAG